MSGVIGDYDCDCEFCGASKYPGDCCDPARVKSLRTELENVFVELSNERMAERMAERSRILNWLRVVYRQNRNAQAFADAIEREEHIEFAWRKPDTGHE